MISKHVGYEAAHDNYGALARYIADARHEGEKCLANWCAGCAAEDDYELAIIEAQAVQALNTRSSKEKTYHLLVSFRPKDEATLTLEAFKAIEERFAPALGFSEISMGNKRRVFTVGAAKAIDTQPEQKEHHFLSILFE